MLGNRSRPRIPLPRQWPTRVRSGVLHAISLAHFSLTFTRSWAANSINARIRLKQENDRLGQELALLREEMRDGQAGLCLYYQNRFENLAEVIVHLRPMEDSLIIRPGARDVHFAFPARTASRCPFKGPSGT